MDHEQLPSQASDERASPCQQFGDADSPAVIEPYGPPCKFGCTGCQLGPIILGDVTWVANPACTDGSDRGQEALANIPPAHFQRKYSDVVASFGVCRHDLTGKRSLPRPRQSTDHNQLTAAQSTGNQIQRSQSRRQTDQSARLRLYF